MIDLDNITKRYGSTTVLAGVSVSIARGGVTALIGANGAGKSTLLSAIGRLIPIDSGRIRIDELDIDTAPSNEIAKRLGVLRQDNHLSVRLTVRELVEFGRFPHAGTKLTATDHAHVARAIDQLGLAPLRHRRLDQLSGGQRQRAFIAMVLCQDTDYILLDEPLNSLDMKHAVHTMDLVRSLADDFGKTVVIVLHDINIAGGYADRIIAMRDGAIVADGPPTSVLDRSTISAIYDIDVPITAINGLPVVVSFHPQPNSTNNHLDLINNYAVTSGDTNEQ